MSSHCVNLSQETRSSSTFLTPYWNLWCPSWRSKLDINMFPCFIYWFFFFFLWLSLLSCFSRKLNSFLNKLNPTEEQMAAYIDALCSKLWPEIQQVAAPRTDEEKDETRERAHNLINARCSPHLNSDTFVLLDQGNLTVSSLFRF